MKKNYVIEKEILLEKVRNYKEKNINFENSNNSITVLKNLMLFYIKQVGFNDNFEIAKEEVSINGLSLCYASDELKNNKEFVIESVSENGLALRFASDNLRDCKDVVIKAVRNNCLALKYASESLKNDPDIIYSVILHNNYYLSLCYAGDFVKEQIIDYMMDLQMLENYYKANAENERINKILKK